MLFIAPRLVLNVVMVFGFVNVYWMTLIVSSGTVLYVIDSWLMIQYRMGC
jgi:hypothetical protein